jgi:hypothetical protein
MKVAYMSLEVEDFIGQPERLAVLEVDLHLAGADLVDERVDVQAHHVAVVVDVLEQRVEFVDGVDAVDLAAGLGTAAAADRCGQRQVRVDVFRREVELELRRHQRLPALLGIKLQDAAQHAARGEVDQAAVGKIAVVDDLGGRIDGPRHHRDRAGIGLQDHVAVGGRDRTVEGIVVLGRIAGDGHAQHDFRQAHAAVFGKFYTWQNLAACNAGQVGDQAFDFGDSFTVEPLVHIVVRKIVADSHDGFSVR